MQFAAYALCPGQSPIGVSAVRESVARLADKKKMKPAAISAAEDEVQVQWDGWSIYLGVNAEPYVLVESQEIAERFGADHPRRAAIATASSRIELSSDIDPEMDHFNDYIFVLECLEESFPDAILFDSASATWI